MNEKEYSYYRNLFIGLGGTIIGMLTATVSFKVGFIIGCISFLYFVFTMPSDEFGGG